MELIITRTFQAFSLGTLTVIGRSSIVKLFDKKEATKVFLIVSSVFALSPGIAPIFGGYLTSFFCWQATFIFPILLGLIALWFINKGLPINQSSAISIPSVSR